jgi:hypothetical protein
MQQATSKSSKPAPTSEVSYDNRHQSEKRTFPRLGKQTKAYSSLNAALEFLEGRRNGTIHQFQSQREFLCQKKFVEAGISKDLGTFSLAVCSAKPEWQDRAKEFRQTGELPAYVNNPNRKQTMRVAVEIFDRETRRMIEQLQREETDIGTGNTNNTTASGKNQRPDPPPALPPILPDLKTMADSMVSVANGLNAHQKQFDMISKALESERGKNKQARNEKEALQELNDALEAHSNAAREDCKALESERGKNDQLTKEKEALKEINNALEAHSNEAREQMEKDYRDLQLKFEAECEERKKRKARESEEERYLEDFHRASARKRLKLHNGEQRAIVDAATELTTEEKKIHICMSKASVSLMHENMVLRKKYDELEGMCQEKEKELLLQVSQCKEEQKKRESLADELEQVQRRLSQLQGSVASEEKYKPAADCYDIDI